MLSSFEEKTGKKGMMISAVDLLKGIAVGAGMDNIFVEGANGGLHTNYKGKKDAAVKALTEDGYDFVYIHVEAPDECGHRGECENKVKAIEIIDKLAVGPLCEYLSSLGDFRVLIMPDHPTPLDTKTHSREPVPFLLYDSAKAAAGDTTFTEETAKASGIFVEHGPDIMKMLLEK